MKETRRRRTLRAATLAAAGLALVFGVAACGYATPAADEVGLYYNDGWKEGKNFDHVVEPGTSDDTFSYNDVVYYLPISLRTWNISQDEGADQTEPIVVPTRDGVLVNVWSQANLLLNSNHDDLGEDHPGGTLRKFWETIGSRYSADTEAGWEQMMLVTIVPALEKATTDTIREYDADPLVYNTDGILTEAQRKIGERFLENLKRLSGGDFFCGPAFVRGQGTCPPPELILKGVDFNNPEIQAARDQRRTEEELARARLVEAEGHLEAQRALNKALEDPNYLQYLISQMELQAAQACAQSENCTFISGSGAVPTVPAR